MDAQPLAQFRAASEPLPNDLDESEVIETLERPAVHVQSGHVRVTRSLLPPPNPPPRSSSFRAVPVVSPPPPPATLPLLAQEPVHDAPVRSPDPSFAMKRATLETTPSLAPVALSTSVALASRARAADPTMQLRRRQPQRSPGIATVLALVFAAALAGSIVALAALVPSSAIREPSALLDRLRGRSHDELCAPPAAAPPARSAEPATLPSTAQAVPAAIVSAASAPSVEPAPIAAPAPSAPSAVPVAALPKPKAAIEPDMTLVMLPRSSKGHRVFVDGRVVGSGPAPMKIACGTHRIKIGSRGKPRVTELPCGGELALE